MFLSGVVVSMFLLTSPDEMKSVMDNVEKVDCDKVVESAKSSCRKKCKSSKKKRQDCLDSCDHLLDDFQKNCATLKKSFKEFKKKPQKEQEQILKDAAAEDRSHSH